MPSSAPIRTGLLAYGMSGKLFHAPFITAHAGFELSAVVERHDARMAADYPCVRSYPSVAEFLADPALELVIINTPSGLHVEQARQALLAGKHVLIEKPVAAKAAEWQALGALAQEQGRHLLAYQNRRWDTDFGAVRRVVESGQLGQLIEAHFRYDRYKTALSPKPFKETPGPAVGLAYDLGPHLVDQAISLFGRPLGVRKVQGHYRPGGLIDDFFSFHLRYPAGLNVWLTAGLLVAAPGPAYVLHGTRGSYQKGRTDPQEAQLLAGLRPTDPAYGHELPGSDGHLTLAGPDDGLSTQPDPAPSGNYLGLFDAVAQTIRHNHPYPVRADEVAWQLEILEQPAEA
ncbi:oxidoreductase [Hymenobacter coccineus]|uniref:Oxidoreductase n=2 Tax=Hymenobacter coccineus TaxID=1908235 RepID=A0A1G1SSE0_9BACT|nr:oxidoreductase [Hymenobacter coccineus]